MKYYISDTHFYSDKVIGFDNRPFKDAAQMNEELIRRWNERVKRGDEVYIVGDFCWDNRRAAEIAQQLNGRKFLILGNHDFEGTLARMKCFEQITPIKKVHDGEYTVLLCHYPIPCYLGDHNLSHVMLYGHVHTTPEYKDMLMLQYNIQHSNAFVRRNELYPNNSLSYAQFYNVGCMLPYMNYTPRTLTEIMVGGQAQLDNAQPTINIC